MNTREFLSLLLPESGIKYLATLGSFIKDGKTIPYFKHYPVDDPAQAASHAMELDDNGETVYFALAGYLPPVQRKDAEGRPVSTATGRPRMDVRTQSLAACAKAFWMDIDCGEAKSAAGKGYATKKSAASAVVSFCREVGLGNPLFVDSGGGLHCYWPLTKEIKAAQWTALAPVWRGLINHFGVLSDPARDMDIASVLRPIGTANRKYEGRQVKVINPSAFRISTPREFAAALLTAQEKFKPARVHAPAPAKGRSKLDDMGETREFPPSSAKVIVTRCNQVLQFHQKLGDVDEPTWRAMLGLLKHTVEGDAIAHEWSSGHPEYNDIQTQEKLDRWSTGPTSCEHFKTCNPTACATCTYKVKSPIMLGFEVPVAAEPAPVVEAEQEENPGFVYPAGYSSTNGELVITETDADGNVVPRAFCSVQFWPVARIRKADGRFVTRFEVHKHGGKISHFELDTSLVASNQLVENLAAFEIFPVNLAMKKHLQQYALTVCQQLTKRAREVRSYASMGWQDNATTFVIGERCYNPNGTVTPAILNGHAASRANAFAQLYGTWTDWADGIDILYNRPNAEPFQYAICSAFGSLLGVFKETDNYKGIPVALTDQRSGQGKSTVCFNALRAFGEPGKMFVNGKEGITAMARSAIMSGQGNIPLLLDEITEIDPKDLSELLYAASNGQDRIRLDAAARIRDVLTWNMSVFTTANEDLLQKLELSKENSQAEMVRLFEINVRQYPLPHVTPAEFDRAKELLAKTAGTPGELYIKHIVQDRAAVIEMLKAYDQELRAQLPAMDDQKYRFYRIHAECTLTAATVMHKLGLVKFDLGDLKAWVLKHLCNMCMVVNDATLVSRNDAIHRMINFLGPQILVTNGYRLRKDGCEDPLHPIRGTPIGRHIIGQDNKTEQHYWGKLLLERNAVKHWCASNRVNMQEMIDIGVRDGYIQKPNDERVVIGRGTYVTTGQTRGIIIDMKKLTDTSPLKVVPKHDINEEESA